MVITLKAARDLLESRGYKVDLRTMKHAARKKTLKARLVEESPVPYYITTEEDAIHWAETRSRGNPNWRKESEGEK